MSKSLIRQILIIACFVFCFAGLAQLPIKSITQTNWAVKEPFEQKVFIENNGGQFNNGSNGTNEKIYFSTAITGVNIYFSAYGVLYLHDLEINNAKEKKTLDREQDKGKHKITPRFFSVKWKGADTDGVIIPEDEVSAYYTYSVNGHAITSHAFKKLLYKNIYKGIDIEYSFTDDRKGLEYSIIVHPDADLTQVKLQYDSAMEIKQNTQGDIVMQSTFGQFTDHAPVNTFYNEDKNTVKSYSILQGNEILFSAGSYDHSKTLVIDPWVANPTFNGYANAYDVDYDFNGNVYVYGGLPRYQLQKYNSNGVLIWAYTTTLGDAPGNPLWVGDFTVDHRNGTSYITKGLGGAGTDIVKINTLGTYIAADSSIDAELWKIKFDYCNNQLVIGAGAVGAKEACVMDTNLKSHSFPNVLGTSSSDCCHDMCLLALDQIGNAYMATNASSFSSSAYNNLMLRAALPFLSPVNYIVSDGYSFGELLYLKYYPAQSNGGYDYACGFNGMAVDKKMLVTYDGSVLKKWLPATGKFQKSLIVTTTPFLWGGLDIDCADNIYLGSKNNVNIYDSSLTLLSTIPLTDTLFDVKLGNNQIYACGAGFVSSNTYKADTTGIVINRIPPSSCSACDGKATAFLTGCGADSISYSYLWSTGQTIASITDLCYGTYTVTINIDCQRQYSDTFNFAGSSSGGMTLLLNQTNITCGSINDGTASVLVSGGTSPYTYDWLPSGNTTSSVNNLTTGIYTIVVNDKNSHCISGTVFVQPAPSIGIKLTSLKNETCPGTHDGSASISASGGNSPYKYNWAPSGGAGNSAFNLSAGVYTVTVTDLNGCIGKDTITIGGSALSTLVSVTTTNASCTGANNGTATVTTPPGLNIITWSSSGSGSNTISGLAPGNYYVTVHDSNTGCSVTDSFKITRPALFKLNTSQFNNICFGQNNGSASVSATGTGGYIYSWNTGNTNTSIINLAAGTYSVTVTDSTGCVNTAAVTITQPTRITPTINSVNLSCKGKNNGSATAMVSGGISPYIYNWLPSGSTNTSINNLSLGIYTLTVTDSNGCFAKDSVTITIKPETFNISGSDSICIGSPATLSVTGATSYIWNNGATTSSINISPPITTTYSVLVTDTASCKDSLFATISVNPYPIITICCNNTIYPGQSVQLSATGGGSYIWNPNYGLTCYNCPEPVASPNQTINYILTVINKAGCAVKDSILIRVENCGTVFIPEAFSPNRDGENDILYVRGDCIKSLQFEVFDRWGNRVFETADKNIGWNGMYKGQAMNTGSYVYYLTASMYDGTTVSKKGNVSLVR